MNSSFKFTSSPAARRRLHPSQRLKSWRSLLPANLADWSKHRTVPRNLVPPGGHVVVIGAGLAGLSAALHLRGAGYQVTVMEQANQVGGRCATERLTCPTPDGNLEASFDTGATVLTMPALADEALAAVGLDLDSLLAELPVPTKLVKLNPAYHTQIPTPGVDQWQSYNVPADTSGDNFHRLHTWLAEIFEASFDNFMGRSFDSPANMVGDRSSRADLLRLLRLGAFGSLGRAVVKHLPKNVDPELRRVFSFQALYAGVGPDQARAVYGCIAHMDTALGVYYPVSQGGAQQEPHSTPTPGIGALAEALALGCRQRGIEIRLGTSVQGLQCEGNHRVTGIHTADDTVPCDAIVATVDREMIDHWLATSGAKPPRRLLRRQASPSAVVAHGLVPREITATWPNYHHTISFGHKWEETFAEICAPDDGKLMSDPSLLITRPAVSDPRLVVGGGARGAGAEYEPVNILAPCPNLESAHLPWEALAAPYLQEILGELEKRGFAGVRENFHTAKIVTPVDWQAAGMTAGSPFGLAHLFRQTGPFRPRNYSAAYPANVVFAGSTTVPGVGVPTVLVSGRLAAQRISAEPKSERQ